MGLTKQHSAYALMLASSLLLLTKGIWFRESYGGDEGYHLTVALNMIKSGDFMRPDSIPGGREGDWQADFFEGFPPLQYTLLALGIFSSGGRLAGAEFVACLTFLLTLFFAYKLVETWDRTAAFLSVLLLAVSPAVIVLFGTLECEPVLTMFGMGGLYFLAAAEQGRSFRRYLLAGVFLGLAFLSKLWLAAPFLLSAGVMFVIPRLMRRRIEPSDLGCAALTAAGFVLAGSSHIIAVALLSPQDLSLWLSRVYFGAFGGTAFNKFKTADVPANWMHPIWYYPAILYRDHFFLLTFSMLGLPSFLKRPIRDVVVPLGMLLAGLSSIALFSLPPVKEPLYILPGIVFCYLLAGFCLSSLLNAGLSEERLRRGVGTAAGAVVLVLMLAVLVAYTRGLKRDDITLGYAVTHTLVSIGLAAFAFVQTGKARRHSLSLLAAGCLAALAVYAGYTMATTVPRDRVIAEVIRPYLADRAPQDESFIAPNYKSYQAYLYRRGRYWKSHQFEIPDGKSLSRFTAFVLGPEELQDPEMGESIRFLELGFEEKTADVVRLLGREIPYRLFVNRAANPVESGQRG